MSRATEEKIDAARRKKEIQARSKDLERLFNSLADPTREPTGGSGMGRPPDTQGGQQAQRPAPVLKKSTRAPRGGGAMITANGKAVVLSAESRRLPTMFNEHRRNVHQIESSLEGINATLSVLTTGFNRQSADSMLPKDLAAAVEENHKQQLDNTGFQHSAAQKRLALGQMPLEGVSAAEAEADWQQRVVRSRTAAADEGFVENQSVADYSAEPHVPKLVKGSTIREEITAIDDCLTKIDVCGSRLEEIERDRDVVWWSSALRTRDVKSLAVRANYHARRGFLWSRRAMEHLLLQSTYLNQQSSRQRADLVRLRQQIDEFGQRAESSVANTTRVTAEIADVQKSLDQVGMQRSRLQDELVDVACNEGLLFPGNLDPLSAELVLLLEHTRWPADTMEDVHHVSQWLHTKQMSLE